MRESHWHWFAHQLLNMFYPVETVHTDIGMKLLDQVLECAVKSCVFQFLQQPQPSAQV